MDFNLTDKQEMIRKTMREFAESFVKPLAAEIDRTERFPGETLEKLRLNNRMGIPIPLQYGGAGMDTLSYIIAIEELSRVCAATGVTLSTHTSLVCYPIYAYGTEKQKEKYLKPLAKGESLGAFGLTEPDAGTDILSLKTTAIRNENYYIINGAKRFITNGSEADIYVIFAVTDKSQGSRGLSAFILERGTKGFIFGKTGKKMGIRASTTCELIFENVCLPVENLLGKGNDGYSIALTTLDGGRIAIAAQALGIAQGAFDETVQYLKQRQQFGKPLATNQGLQWNMADMATMIEAARLLVYHAAMLKQEGKPYRKEAAMAKLFASETAMAVTTKAVQLHGGRGYTSDYSVERMMRDAKITEIYEGTSEAQRMAIASQILPKSK